jgi:hypothetical protein
MKNKIFDGMTVLLLVFGLFWMWHDVRIASSRSPHHIISVLGVTTIADYWTTNPVVVKREFEWGTSNGLPVPLLVYRTNYLWKRY